ncbi:MAG TPA: hypothetical protein VFF53_08515 [Geobacteraceae bacterium]|nr:hypothetical protein [Geobacteraceae bacterium]
MNGRLLFRFFASGVLLLSISFLSEGHAADSGEFKGSWIANGTRTPFAFGTERQVFIYKITGHVNLHNAPLGKKKDFWAECVGLADSVTGLVGRCVWKDLTGPEVYLTIQSDQLEQGSQVTGTIVGGSGRFAGISGDLSFNWSSVIVMKDADGTVSVNGETKNIDGHYRIP